MDRSKLCITVDEAAELASVAPAVQSSWTENQSPQPTDE